MPHGVTQPDAQRNDNDRNCNNDKNNTIHQFGQNYKRFQSKAKFYFEFVIDDLSNFYFQRFGIIHAIFTIPVILTP
jgi:hypothetical protein